MVNLNMKVDDVLLTRNKIVRATDQRRVPVPGYANGGRKKTLKFEVSDAGAQELDKLIATAEAEVDKIDAEVEKRKSAAWKPILDLVAARDAALSRQEAAQKDVKPSPAVEPEATAESEPDQSA